MRHILPDSIRLNLTLVVVLGALPILAMLLLSGLDLREQEVHSAKVDAMRLARSFADQQSGVTLGVRQMLSAVSLNAEVQRLDGKASSELFRALIRDNPSHANITLLRPDGEVVASALPFTRSNFSGQKHVEEAKRTRSFAVGEYLVGRISTEPIIAFAYPVLDKSGKLLGVLTTSLKLSRYVELFKAARLPEMSTLSVSDHQGIRLLYHPPSPTNAVGAALSPWASRELLGPAPKGLALLTALDGVSRYYAFHQLRLAPEAPAYMVIAVGISEEQVLAKADHLTEKYLLWLGVAAGLSLLVSWFISKYGIILPLTRFADLARSVGRGDLDAVTGMAGARGTLGIVAAAFDGMTKGLKVREAERTQALLTLRESEALLNETQEISRLGGWEYCLESRLMGWTDEVFRIHEVSRETYDPNDIDGNLAFYDEEGRAELERAFAKTVQDGTPYDLELPMTTARGRKIWVRSLGKADVRDGKVQRLSGLIMDITDRKRDEELRQQIERTIGHNLRTPASNAINIARMLRDDGADLTAEQRTSLLDLFEQAGRNMLDTLNSSLDLYRIETGSYQLEPEECDCLRVVKDIIASLKTRFEGRQASVLLNGQPVGQSVGQIVSQTVEANACCLCLGVPSLLRSALQNLLTNAFEASPPGATVAVDLSSARGCRIEIRNRGAVPAEIRDRFFDKYVTRGKLKGTGIGTYSARLMVQAQGGSITMSTSDDDDATVLTVCLPKPPPQP